MTSHEELYDLILRGSFSTFSTATGLFFLFSSFEAAITLPKNGYLEEGAVFFVFFLFCGIACFYASYLIIIPILDKYEQKS
jgi:hypothetical protein